MDLFLRPPPAGELVRKFRGEAASGKRKGSYPVHWLQSPPVLRHCVNPQISGDPDVVQYDLIIAR